MTTIEQLNDFSRYAKQIVEQEGKELPLDVIFDRWHRESFAEEDLRRIQASASDYEAGERGRPVDEFLSEFKTKQDLDKNQ